MMFTPETLEFFMAIRFNNNREFFYSNHDEYVKYVRKPLLDLAEELAPVIESIDPNLERRPEKTVSRINRDLRFSRDKSPYRDWMWIGFHNPENKHTTPGFYVDISCDGLGFGMGMYEDNKPLMDAHRQKLLTRPKEFENALTASDIGLPVQINVNKRMKVPEDVPDNLKAYYPLRTFVISASITDTDLIFSPKLSAYITEHYLKMKPMYDYFAGLSPVTV